MASRDVTWKQLRRAVPPQCFVPSTARSLAYLGVDLAILTGLYLLALRAPWWSLPALWAAQGTMFWALFVIGHDCGHGAFSHHRWLETLIGHLIHTPLLVPYHAWRLSHRRHHRHTGHVERDEGWVPLSSAQVDELSAPARWLRFRGVLFALPFYFWRGTPGRAGSHFDPRCDLFPSSTRRAVTGSIALCGLAALGLIAWGVHAGAAVVVRHYLGPWLVFVMWTDLVTYLHHTDVQIPWYRDGAWTFLDGALATVDRHYGPLERIHHHAGCHVVHHLFPTIPHYHLRQATVAVVPALGDRYRCSTMPVWDALRTALRRCQVVPVAGARIVWEPYARLKSLAPLGSGAGSRPATR